MRKISIIHPSRNRAQLAIDTINKWLSVSVNPTEIEYILSLDTDESMDAEYVYLLEHVPYDIHTVYHDNRSAIDAINNAAKLATGDILIVVSDDFDCPDRWDESLLNAIGDQTDILVKTGDGAQTWIITLPIMDRKYYERFGYIYYPEYRHMFCDTEMTHVGDLLGRTIRVPILFRHRHYSVGGIPRDAISDKNDQTWGQGEALYIQRVQENFGLGETDIKGKLSCHPGHIIWLRQRGIPLN